MKDGETVKLRAFRAAFPYTLPIFAGFWFIGLAYGIYMNVSGFSFVYPMVMSAVIFGGSLEFVAVSMLLSPFARWNSSRSRCCSRPSRRSRRSWRR